MSYNWKVNFPPVSEVLVRKCVSDEALLMETTLFITLKFLETNKPF